ncbi:MAG: hypothetical protein K2N47_05125, partial [Clostridia bacterium]|nr:hypothetical protein [Clostridia bacterium]
MRKTRKWLIISAVLALCITACASLFAGCINTPDDTAITYTVTVLTNEETPLSGVSVQLRKGSNRVGDPVTTGADGKAEFEAAPDTYNASITPPTPYSVPAGTNVTLTKDKPNLTVKLQKDSYYTVKLVKPDGTAFYDANVTVGVCTDENCLQAVELSTSGVATMKAAPGNYHVKVYDLPENYAIDVDENGYYTGETFTAESTEMTIKLCDVVKIDLTGTAMTAAEKTAYATSNEAYTETAQALDAYKGTKHLAGGEVVFFSVTAEFSGNYSLFLDETLSYSAGWSGGYFFNGSSCTLEGGMTYKFRFENVGEDAVDTEFVVAIPDASYVEKSGTNVDTINLRINKQGAIAIISFIPEEGGTYTLSVKDGVQAYAEASN